MYGTVARIRLKAGNETRLQEQIKGYETLNLPGYVGMTVYRMDDNRNELYMAVVFDDRESYHANAQSPEQDVRYREMVELLEGEPEWHDGEVVYSLQPAPSRSSAEEIASVDDLTAELDKDGRLGV